MGIRDRPIARGSPWQNGIAERLIGTLRRECLDQVIVFGEAQLRRVLSAYAAYYNQTRPNLALQKDTPLKRAHPTDRQRCGHPDPWRITSPIRPDMIFGKDTRAATADGGQAVTRRCTREVLMRLKARAGNKIEAARISGRAAPTSLIPPPLRPQRSGANTLTAKCCG